MRTRFANVTLAMAVKGTLRIWEWLIYSLTCWVVFISYFCSDPIELSNYTIFKTCVISFDNYQTYLELISNIKHEVILLLKIVLTSSVSRYRKAWYLIKHNNFITDSLKLANSLSVSMVQLDPFVLWYKKYYN